MSAGSFTLSGLSAGLPTGENALGPITFVGTNTIGSSYPTALASGDNTITVPSGSTAVAIIPPPGNAVAIKVRTSADSSDAGVSINPGAGFFVLCFPSSAPASVILNAASAIAAPAFTSLVFI